MTELNHTFTHRYADNGWPSIKSEYADSYDFEVFDFPKTHEAVSSLKPYIFGSAVAYVLAVFAGQAFMKSRPAYKLKGPLILWNIALAIYSMVTFWRCWPEFWYTISQPNGIYLSVCSSKIHSYPMAFWSFVFFFSKFVEFGDTAFIILRKQKLIFLHWYHHVTTYSVGFLMIEAYDPATKYVIIINSFVHSWMYSYYALKALKVPVPERAAKYITRIQITQMVIILAVNIYSLFIMEQGLPCERKRSNVYSTFGVAFTFLCLFGNFFIQRYRKGNGGRVGKTKSS